MSLSDCEDAYSFASSDVDEMEREELEIALYSQIHFESNPVTYMSDGNSSSVKMQENSILSDNLSKFNFAVKESSDKMLTYKKKYIPETITSGHGLDVILPEDSENEDTHSKYVLEKKISTSSNISKDLKSDHGNSIIILSDSDSESICSVNSISSYSKVISISDSTNGSEDEGDSSDVDSDDLMLLDEEFSLEKMKGLQLHVEGIPKVFQKGNDYFIKDSGTHKPSPTSKRYYSPINARCFNCKEVGHISNACQKPKKHLICHLCGLASHHISSCPSKVCFNCQGVGHTFKDCKKPKKYRMIVCSRCHVFGHNAEICPDQWRMYHLTTEDSDVLVRGKDSCNPSIFCHNCASSKHFAFKCKQKRMKSYIYPNYPFICEYKSPTNSLMTSVTMSSITGTSADTRRKNQSRDKISKSFKHIKGSSECRESNAQPHSSATKRRGIHVIDSNWNSMKQNKLSTVKNKKKKAERTDSLGDIRKVMKNVVRNDLEQDIKSKHIETMEQVFPRTKNWKNFTPGRQKKFGELDELDHQVFSNEYWKRNGFTQKKKRKRDRCNFGDEGIKHQNMFHSQYKRKKMDVKGEKKRSKNKSVDRGFRKSMS